MHTAWTMDDLDWSAFDPSKVDGEILKVIKAAAVVERNAGDYTAYLARVFRHDPDFVALLEDWRADEVKHGEVLGRYAQQADPGFDFPAAFDRFTALYRIDVEAETSVRGSPTGELLARCIVETGTSSFYSAVRDAVAEPLLKDICHRIAGDEFRHYKLFLDAMRRAQTRDHLPLWRRILLAVGRIRETDDDELAGAWHAANEAPQRPYDRAHCNAAYAVRAYGLYRRIHAERAASMVVKALGLDPNGLIGRWARAFAWSKMRQRAAA